MATHSSPLQVRFVRNVTTWREMKPGFYHGHVAYLDFSKGRERPSVGVCRRDLANRSPVDGYNNTEYCCTNRLKSFPNVSYHATYADGFKNSCYVGLDEDSRKQNCQEDDKEPFDSRLNMR
ncbi:hypothetical protein CCH79_00011069 [Gambusia affinis]|uniref:Uncharacterized protein n=1 Tax=Gambusia affinis TaxID=33528 RepID=A0A315V652_GAMAF|nr:hypothetical protein CCH79_00011069 [Gambusia affinis]